MFSYTVMVIDLIDLIDLIDPVDFPYCGQHGQHSQQPCADRSAGKISVTPPTNPKTLTDVNASRVPELGCGWKDLVGAFCQFRGLVLGGPYRVRTGTTFNKQDVRKLIERFTVNYVLDDSILSKPAPVWVGWGYTIANSILGLRPTYFGGSPAGQHQAEYQSKPSHSCQHTQAAGSGNLKRSHKLPTVMQSSDVITIEHTSEY